MITLSDKLKALRTNFPLQLQKDLLNVTQKIVRNAQRTHRYKAKSGSKLRSATKSRRLNNYLYELYLDLNIAPYAYAVHNGSRATKIVVKNKKALRWRASKGARSFAFAKSVYKPAIPADPFLLNAYKNGKRLADRYFKGTLKRALK